MDTDKPNVVTRWGTPGKSDAVLLNVTAKGKGAHVPWAQEPSSDRSGRYSLEPGSLFGQNMSPQPLRASADELIAPSVALTALTAEVYQLEAEAARWRATASEEAAERATLRLSTSKEIAELKMRLATQGREQVELTQAHATLRLDLSQAMAEACGLSLHAALSLRCLRAWAEAARREPRFRRLETHLRAAALATRFETWRRQPRRPRFTLMERSWRALQQWRGHMLRWGCSSWRDATIRRRRLIALLRRSCHHWGTNETGMALHSWKAACERRRWCVALVHRSCSLWRDMLTGKALRSWHARTTTTAAHRVLCERTVRQWHSWSSARAWHSWTAFIAVRERCLWLVGTALHRLTHSSIAWAMRSWAAAASRLQYSARTLRRGRAAFTSSSVVRAFVSWVEAITIIRRRGDITERRAHAVRRLLAQPLVRAWAILVAAGAARRLMRPAVQCWMDRSLSRCWNSWLMTSTQSTHVLSLVRTCVSRWLRARTVKALGTWRACTTNGRLVRACVSRWVHSLLTLAMHSWDAHVQARGILTRRLRLGVCALAMRTCRLSFSSWRDASVSFRLRTDRSAQQIGRAVIHWTQHDLTRAWSTYVERCDTRLRVCALARRAIGHMSNRGAAAGWHQWVAIHTSHKHAVATIARALQPWRCSSLTKAWNSWRASLAGTRTLWLVARAVLLWQMHRMARAWRRWAIRRAEQRMLSRAADQWRRRGPARALRRWSEFGTSRRGAMVVIDHALRLFVHLRRARGYRTWVAAAATQHVNLRLISRALTHLCLQGSVAVLARWKHVVNEHHAFLNVCGRAITLWRHRQVAAAWRGWKAADARYSRVVALTSGAVSYWLQQSLAHGWRQLARRAATRAHSMCQLRLGTRLLTDRQLTLAFASWLHAHRLSSRLAATSRMLASAISQWLHLRMARGWRRWAMQWHELQRLLHLGRSTALRMLQVALFRAMRVWGETTKSQAHVVRLLRLGIGWMHNQPLATTLSLWRRGSYRTHVRRMVRGKLRRGWARWISAWVMLLANACPPAHPELNQPLVFRRSPDPELEPLVPPPPTPVKVSATRALAFALEINTLTRAQVRSPWVRWTSSVRRALDLMILTALCRRTYGHRRCNSAVRRWRQRTLAALFLTRLTGHFSSGYQRVCTTSVMNRWRLRAIERRQLAMLAAHLLRSVDLRAIRRGWSTWRGRTAIVARRQHGWTRSQRLRSCVALRRWHHGAGRRRLRMHVVSLLASERCARVEAEAAAVQAEEERARLASLLDASSAEKVSLRAQLSSPAVAAYAPVSDAQHELAAARADAKRWHAAAQEGWIAAARSMHNKHAAELTESKMMTSPSQTSFIRGNRFREALFTQGGVSSGFPRNAAAIAAELNASAFQTPKPRPPGVRR